MRITTLGQQFRLEEVLRAIAAMEAGALTTKAVITVRS